MTVKVFDEEWPNEQFAAFMRPFNGKLFSHFGNKVRGGPFEGMQIPPECYFNSWAGGIKLLGRYEPDLVPAIERAVSRQPATVINIGCAEGYYAIGMLLRLPQAQAFAVDIDPDSLALCGEYASRNGVGERLLTLRGPLKPELLTFGNAPRLYISDCEGAEFEIFDPVRCPAMREADLIIEIHGWMGLGDAQSMAERFKDTHEVEVIMPGAPDMGYFGFVWPGDIQQVVRLVNKLPEGAAYVAAWAKR